MTLCRRVLLVSLVSLLSLGAALGGREARAEDERIVTPAEGTTNFVVQGKSTKFRLAVSAIGGGEIKAPKIRGKAKLVRSSDITRADADGELVGQIEKEFEFQATAAGQVVIEIEKIEPTSPEPIVEKYTVTIK